MACTHGGLQGKLQLFQGGDDDGFAAVFCAPDWQGDAPVAASAKVPVIEVFQPVSKAAGAGAFRLPLDPVIQALQAVFCCRGLDEPAVHRVVQDGLVGAPAMRVAVGVFLNLEGFAFQLQGNPDLLVHAELGGFPFIVVFAFHVLSGEVAHDRDKATLQVHQGNQVAVLVGDHHARNACCGSDPGIILTKGGGGVNQSRAIFCGDKVTGDDHKGLVCSFMWLAIRQKLLVADANQVSTKVLRYPLPGQNLPFRQGQVTIKHLIALSEMGRQQLRR